MFFKLKVIIKNGKKLLKNMVERKLTRLDTALQQLQSAVVNRG